MDNNKGGVAVYLPLLLSLVLLSAVALSSHWLYYCVDGKKECYVSGADLSDSEMDLLPVYGAGGIKGAPLAGSGACRERRSAPDPLH